MIRVAIAEEQSIVRWALREALAKSPDLEIVGEAGTALAALELLRRTKPDVLLLDAAIPLHAELDVLAEIRDLDDGPFVVVLASQSEPGHAARAVVAGAHGCVSRSDEPEQLLGAIRAVGRGEQIISPAVATLAATGDGHPARTLSVREQQVMEMLARGMTNREIAEHLAISIKTVDTHRSHVLKKLRLRNNSDLTRFAVRHRYVSL